MTFCALLMLALLPFLLGGAHAPGGSVPSYDAVVTVREGGTVHVREAFTFDYLGTHDHGLVRGVRRRDGDRLYRMRGLTVASTTGAPVGVETADFLHRRSIVIGAGRPVSGRHSYVLSYELLDVLTPGAERDELVWEPLDPGWPVPVEKASVRIEGPASFTSGCLAGAPGAITHCGRWQAGPTAVEFRQDGLRPHEGMKVRAAFPRGVLGPLTPRYAPSHLAFTPWGWMALLLAFPLVLVARYRTPGWLRRGLLAAGACVVLWDLLAETASGGFGLLSVGDPLLGGAGLLILGGLAARRPALRRG